MRTSPGRLVLTNHEPTLLFAKCLIARFSLVKLWYHTIFWNIGRTYYVLSSQPEQTFSENHRDNGKPD